MPARVSRKLHDRNEKLPRTDTGVPFRVEGQMNGWPRAPHGSN
jgi:hypothetical protein